MSDINYLENKDTWNFTECDESCAIDWLVDNYDVQGNLHNAKYVYLKYKILTALVRFHLKIKKIIGNIISSKLSYFLFRLITKKLKVSVIVGREFVGTKYVTGLKLLYWEEKDSSIRTGILNFAEYIRYKNTVIKPFVFVENISENYKWLSDYYSGFEFNTKYKKLNVFLDKWWSMLRFKHG